MKKRGKRYQASAELVDKGRAYDLDEAIALLKKMQRSRFDEAVEIVLRLGVNPKKSDEAVRGSCVLPAGSGKKTRVVAFCKGEKIKEATEAGADYVGGKELADKIAEGWLEFDRVAATPDMMPIVGKLGRILGPRGMMPNPKVGTVDKDIGNVVRQLKLGQLAFRVDKGANLHSAIGRISFADEDLKSNIASFLGAVKKAKPASSKGTYIKSAYICSTHSPSVKLDVKTL